MEKSGENNEIEEDLEEFDEEEKEEEEEHVVDKSKSADNNSEDPMKNYEFDGETYIYTDKTSNITYRFDREKNEWIVKDKDETGCEKNYKSASSAADGAIYGFENDTHTRTDPTDGTVYLWDKDKNAWFPKVNDFFLIF